MKSLAQQCIVEMRARVHAHQKVEPGRINEASGAAQAGQETGRAFVALSTQ